MGARPLPSGLMGRVEGATGQAMVFVYDFYTMASIIIVIVVYGVSCGMLESLCASITEIENSI